MKAELEGVCLLFERCIALHLQLVSNCAADVCDYTAPAVVCVYAFLQSVQTATETLQGKLDLLYSFTARALSKA